MQIAVNPFEGYLDGGPSASPPRARCWAFLKLDRPDQFFGMMDSLLTHMPDDAMAMLSGNDALASRLNDDFISMIENSPIESCVISYRDEDSRLVGCVLTDVQDDGLSAVYSFFDPADSARSLGTYMILDLLRYTAERDLPWLYLGYFVAGSQKMMYKSRFQPAEVFVDGSWQAYSDSTG